MRSPDDVLIAVTGGGTGGHIYPALAVAEALGAMGPGVRLVYIGASDGMEKRLAAERDIPFVGVPARKIRRLASADTLVTLAVLLRGYACARRELGARRPAAVLGTGGYVAAAAVMAAAGLGIPIVLHEQNAVAGRTNRWLAGRAKRVCVTYEASCAQFPGGKAVVTGLPTRTDIVSPRSRDEARARFGVPADASMALVLGGSQGAVALNRAILGALPLLPDDLFVLHQTGRHSAAEGAPPDLGGRYAAHAYLDAETLPLAYRAADLVVSRCGASTLAELAANGLPAILVPYPAAYADHQTANAQAVCSKGAAVLMPQNDLTPGRLRDEIGSLIGDRTRLSAMAEASRSLARPDAASDVAAVVMEVAGR